MSADEVVALIRQLPITFETCKKLIGAVETYANDCKEGGDTEDVCAHLLNAYTAMESVYAWEHRNAA
jgi:hypothetical protein